MSNTPLENYGIRDGYQHRETPTYFVDDSGAVTWQPDVYNFAHLIAAHTKSKAMYDVGCGNGDKLRGAPCKVFGYDFGQNISEARLRHPKHTFVERDLEYGVIARPVYVMSTMICADVIEHLQRPKQLARDLAYYMSVFNTVIISTPDRLRTYGHDHAGPPANPCHAREWALPELTAYMRSLGANIRMTGYTRNNDVDHEMSTAIIVGGVAEVNFAKIARNCAIEVIEKF